MQKMSRTLSNTLYNNPALKSRVEEFFTKLDFSGGYNKKAYKKNLFRQIISKLHYPIEIDDTSIHFTIRCQCHNGLGDLMFAVKTIQSLAKHFPSSQREFEYIAEDSALPFKDYLEKEGIIARDSSNSENQTEKDDALSILIDVATPESSISHPDGKIVYHIDEYNGWRCKGAYRHLSASEYKKRGWHSAGIGKSSCSLPTVGIHIDTSRQQPSEIDALHNAQLKKDLKSILAKNPESRIFFGYNSTGNINYLHRFIRTIILADQTSESLVFVIRDTNPDFPPIRKEFLDKLQNISKIRHFNYEERYRATVQKTKVSTDREVTFILTDQLDPQDMITMRNISEGPTLLSGDQSFAEIISMNDKIPFYQVQPWKRDLIEQFTKTAEYLFGRLSTIVHFLDATTLYCFDEEEETETIAVMAGYLQENNLQSQFNTLFQYLRSYYNIEHWLIGDIKKQILRHKHSQLAEIEKLQYKSSDSITHKMERIMQATRSVLGKRPPAKKLKGRSRKKVKMMIRY